MSNYHGPRVPLHVQQPSLQKAASRTSSETFRENRVFEPDYRMQKYPQRPTTSDISRIRRNPDGSLDYQWARSAVIAAINNLQFEHSMTPLEEALVTIMYPEKIRMMEPAIAELRTQLSNTEKTKLRAMIKEDLIEMENWNAGSGGGNAVKPYGMTKTRAGTP
jgi:hypothetical protein